MKMLSQIFCIVIPIAVYNPNGTYYISEERYECFNSQSKCEEALADRKVYLKYFQKDKKLKAPYCKVDKEIILEKSEEEKEESHSWFKF